jgi:di/tripeptidase
VDDMMNVYATKTSEGYEDKLYPCMVAHTDTVHRFEDEIHVREEMLPNRQKQSKLSLKSYDPNGKPVGIGGDDKCGVYGALVSLRDLPHVKGAFFVSEETGCWGSREASPEFFSDVAYAIQLDAPSNYMVTEVCSGTRLFDRNSDFYRIADEVLTESFEYHEFMIHPYTDVSQLKKKFDFSCINFSCGYYNYHTAHEYVVIEDLQTAIHTAHKMIERLGYTKHEYERQGHNRSLPWDTI